MMSGGVVPFVESRGPAATKERILDAAETLFMEHGFEATSMRLITAAGRRESRRRQLSLRQQGRVVPGGC
jgi:hypothetical protein